MLKQIFLHVEKKCTFMVSGSGKVPALTINLDAFKLSGMLRHEPSDSSRQYLMMVL